MLGTLHPVVTLSVQGGPGCLLFSKESMADTRILATCDDVYLTRGFKDSSTRN